MSLKNTPSQYGRLAKALHWIMAIGILAMFGLGLWMRSLDYYSPWYKAAPHWHQSIGIVLFGLLIFRFIWRQLNPRPDDHFLKPFERRAAHATHMAFYLLLLALMVAGYFITTVDGTGLDVFNWFTIPSVYRQAGAEEIAGFIHEKLAWAVILLAGVHSLAALKHHFIDKDVTLLRMLPTRRAKPAPGTFPTPNPHQPHKGDWNDNST